jgi:hypothetical protein
MANRREHRKGDAFDYSRAPRICASKSLPPISTSPGAALAPSLHELVDIVRDILVAVGPEPYTSIIFACHALDMMHDARQYAQIFHPLKTRRMRSFVIEA